MALFENKFVKLVKEIMQLSKDPFTNIDWL